MRVLLHDVSIQICNFRTCDLQHFLHHSLECGLRMMTAKLSLEVLPLLLQKIGTKVKFILAHGLIKKIIHDQRTKKTIVIIQNRTRWECTV